jgi:hypothetical protein
VGCALFRISQNQQFLCILPERGVRGKYYSLYIQETVGNIVNALSGWADVTVSPMDYASLKC